MFAACTEDQPPTAPAEPGDMAEGHTAGHKVVNSLADPGNGPCNATQCTLREAINDPGSTEISFAPDLTGPITLAPPAAGGGTLTINKTLSITGPSQRIVIRRRTTDPLFRIFRIDPGVTVRLTNLTIQGGRLSGGSGGAGISNTGTLRLINSVVAGNSAAMGGGGIVNFGTLGGTLRLINSTVSDNSGEVGGGINNIDGTLTLTQSRVSNNNSVEVGGGINNNGSAARLTLTNSTVSRNSAASGDGGGILITSTTSRTTLRNTTVARNSAAQGGGGIRTSGPLILTNSLVALNTAPQGPDVLKSGGVTVTARFSLLGIRSGSGVSDGVNGNQFGTRSNPLDPLLGPLADNGGPTRTHALLPGSPAIDAASTPDCPTTDQRGVLRPQGAACDIGSYERR
jgi:CSLREA domain-containing protein